MDLASPLVVRATPADRPRTPFTHGVGDLVLTSPARIELDAARLRAAGLTAEVVLTTSPRAWTHLWSGGRVPDEALAPRTGTLDPLPLAVRLAGMFDAGATTPGSLLLVGASEPFTDDHLFDPHADHARFLLQACAASLLEPEFAALLARAPTVGGYRVLEPNERLRARVATLLAGPLLVLVAAFAWRRARARSAVHAAEAAA
jgi:hypothetical protein